ncbi:hypothetical protein ABW21_db0201099 [Orbilia brochopaga]|nr:hypothetical protein ABW21_db0201099 [Drechslerella brochopaga]
MMVGIGRSVESDRGFWKGFRCAKGSLSAILLPLLREVCVQHTTARRQDGGTEESSRPELIVRLQSRSDAFTMTPYYHTDFASVRRSLCRYDGNSIAQLSNWGWHTGKPGKKLATFILEDGLIAYLGPQLIDLSISRFSQLKYVRMRPVK